ncbi:ribose-phosphate pyrophosphokinase [bacterium]|nr:ribose-phosphate pyrophosphokinase [bacterium]
MNENLKVFAGSASIDLAQEIVDYLGIPLGEIEFTYFENDNTFVQIKENVREKDVFLVQTSCRPVDHNFMEALIMTDALMRASAKRITLVMPYYAYARSEKKDHPRIPITAALVGKLVKTAGVSRILTMDLHAEAIQGFFDGPVDQLLARKLVSDHIKQMGLENIVAVSPDVGGANRTRGYAHRLKCPLAILDKRRQNGKVTIFNVFGDVKDKTVIIFDDEIASGGTMKDASIALKDKGAIEIYAAVTHPVFGDGIQENLKKSAFKEIIVTNTIPVNLDPPIDNLTVLSVGQILGDAIKNIHTGASVSHVFLDPEDESDDK